jgi:L-histidine N-alpha-methyltransferase
VACASGWGDRVETEPRHVESPGSSSFCAAVDEGLSATPKSLPTRFLYDLAGSLLFEEITELPEYYLTRCEASIFERSASEMMREAKPQALIEFGSGSSKKTRRLIEASKTSLETYLPIDISTEFLAETSEALLGEFPWLRVSPLPAEYFDAAGNLPKFDGARTILFLGSNIGNLILEEAREFLSRISSQMDERDSVLVGIDLVKDPEIIEAAYNDSKGVTAEFNLNLLRRLNRELDANFALDAFSHRAPYLESEHRIEMRLISGREQDVTVDAIGRSFHFSEGEMIHTEWSHKYTEASFGELATSANLRVQRIWLDDRQWFAVALLRR